MELTEKQAEFLSLHTEGRWTLEDGLVNVEGNFKVALLSATAWKSQLPDDLLGLRFGRVTGNFDVHHLELKSLRGSPRRVGGHFICSCTGIETLEGGPDVVEGGYYCSQNQLTSLVGAPESVRGDFNCDKNLLLDLVGAPRRVGKNFSCMHNALESLAGAPDEVGENFSSDLFSTPSGSWNLRAIATGLGENSRKSRFLGPFISPEALQERIDRNPAKALIELKPILGLPEYQGLRFPEHLEGHKGTLVDLEDIGL